MTQNEFKLSNDFAGGHQQRVNFFKAIENLYNLPLEQIRAVGKSWRAADGLSGQIHFNKKISDLIRWLPLCIMSSILARPPSCFEQAAHGLELLCTLSDVCCSFAPPRDDRSVCMGPDPEFTAQLIDMVNVALLAVAGPESKAIIAEAGAPGTFDAVLHRAVVVSASLRALARIITKQTPNHMYPKRSNKTINEINWPAVTEAVMVHPRGTVILDAAFEAVGVLVQATRTALLSPNILDMPGDRVYALAFHPGSALENLTSWCSSPGFPQDLLVRDDRASVALRLIMASLVIHDAPLAPPPFRWDESRGSMQLVSSSPPYCTEMAKGAAELLAARGFALLLVLGDTSNFLDFIALEETAKDISRELVDRVAFYSTTVLRRPCNIKRCRPAIGEAQMGINVLRAAELLSDDHNYRATLADKLAPSLAHILAHKEREVFASMWCAGNDAVSLMDGDDIWVNSLTPQALRNVEEYRKASVKLFRRRAGQKARNEQNTGRHLALERCILLTKLLGNFHHYDEEHKTLEKHAFLKLLITALKKVGKDGLRHAVGNLELLFDVAWQCASVDGEVPEASSMIMTPLDVALTRDLFDEIKKAAAAEEEEEEGTASVHVAKRQKPGSINVQDHSSMLNDVSLEVAFRMAGQADQARPQMLRPQLLRPQMYARGGGTAGAAPSTNGISPSEIPRVMGSHPMHPSSAVPHHMQYPPTKTAVPLPPSYQPVPARGYEVFRGMGTHPGQGPNSRVVPPGPTPAHPHSIMPTQWRSFGPPSEAVHGTPEHVRPVVIRSSPVFPRHQQEFLQQLRIATQKNTVKNGTVNNNC